MNAKSAPIIIYMRLLIPSIYRRINRKIPHFESSESLMLLCIGEVFFDSEECEGLSTSTLHKIADVVLKEAPTPNPTSVFTQKSRSFILM